MNVLIASLDPDLSRPGSPSALRHAGYAAALRERAGTGRLYLFAPGRSRRPVRAGRGVVVFPYSGPRIFFAAFIFAAMRRLGRRISVGLVASQTPFDDGWAALKAARSLDVPYLAQLHSSSYTDEGWLAETSLNRLKAFVAASVCRRADRVRVMTREAAKRLEASGIPAARLCCVPVPAAVSGRAGPSRAPANGPLKLLYVGRLSPEKNVSLLIEGFARAREKQPIELTVVGEGPLRERLAREADERGVGGSVRFEGWKDTDALEECYAGHHVLVLSSDHESYGRVILEAFAHGLPVVATDTEGSRELVAPGTGWIVPRGDAGLLAERLLEIQRDRDALAAAGRKARERFEAEFHPDAVRAEIVKMWIETAGVRRPLAYVLPEYNAQTDTHFAHLYELLERVGRAAELYLIVEKGQRPSFLRSEQVHLQRFRLAPLRAIELWWVLLALRAGGVRRFYVHYSYFGALIAGIVARFTGARSYYWHCGMMRPFLRHMNRRYGALEWLRQELPLYISARLSSVLVTGSPALKAYYAKTYLKEASAIRVLPNWVNAGRFEGQRKTAGADILFVHRLSERKGAHLLPAIFAKVAAQVPQARLFVVGDGPLREGLKAEFERSGLAGRASVVGKVPNARVRDYYGSCQVLLMPSLEEGVPRVLLESMAAGLPFVATDLPGIRDITTPIQKEFLIAPGDVERFAASAARLIQDETLREELASEGRERAKRYSLDAAERRFKEVVLG